MLVDANLVFGHSCVYCLQFFSLFIARFCTPNSSYITCYQEVSKIDVYDIFFSNQVKVELHDLLQYKVSRITSQGLGVGDEISLKSAKPP